MRETTLFIFIFFAFNLTWGQVDKHGNPIFNSIELSNEYLENFGLACNYYTIDDNIDNKETSVFLSDNPTKEEYIKFARDLPSYFFILRKGQTPFAMVILLQKNEGNQTKLFYNILNPSTGENMEVPCNVWGEVTEKRANELLKLNVDSNAKIIDLPNNEKGLLFDGTTYRIQSYDKLKDEIIELAPRLLKPKEEIDDLKEYIKNETLDGKLDFTEVLEEDDRALFMYDGIIYNKKDFAIYLWGQAVKRLGIKTSKKAKKLWQKIHNRDLTKPEAKALKRGFESKIQ